MRPDLSHGAVPSRAPAALAAVLLAGCGSSGPDLGYEIVATLPHDAGAYTQGLLFHQRHLFESTGRFGASSLRKVDPETGRVLASIALDSAYFGEGLALVGSELIQLTWKSGVALVHDIGTLEGKRQHRYEGEGWGLCYDGTSLYMSNGSSSLFRRDPTTFDIVSEIAVTRNGRAVERLNELECVGEFVYANVYQTDEIVRIEKSSGRVVGTLDGSALSLAGRPLGNPDAVLNGIAYVPETGVFLVTGKLWPVVLAIRLNDE